MAAEVQAMIVDGQRQPGDIAVLVTTVKLLTVHAGKGHEFPVVVLFGLEALPAVVDDRSRQQDRVGFVGATRAKDQLLITYTRANAHLERLLALGDDINHWTWPDDYEV